MIDSLRRDYVFSPNEKGLYVGDFQRFANVGPASGNKSVKYAEIFKEIPLNKKLYDVELEPFADKAGTGVEHLTKMLNRLSNPEELIKDEEEIKAEMIKLLSRCGNSLITDKDNGDWQRLNKALKSVEETKIYFGQLKASWEKTGTHSWYRLRDVFLWECYWAGNYRSWRTAVEGTIRSSKKK